MDTAFHPLTPLSTISFSQYFAFALAQLSDCFAPQDTPSSLSCPELEPTGTEMPLQPRSFHAAETNLQLL